MTRHGDHARTGRSLRAERLVLLGTVDEQPGKVAQRLDIVDDRGLAIEADGGREERRLEARHPAVALERLDQCRLLTDDVGTGTPGQRDIDTELRPHDVLADVPLGVGLVERLGEILLSGGHLASHIQEALAETERVAGDEAALDQLVRVTLHEKAILVGAGLGLVAVDHEVVRELAGRHEAPLDARREAGATTAEHDSVADLFVDIGRRAVEGAAQAVVAIGGLVALEGVGVLVDEAAGDDLGPVVIDIAGGMGDIVVRRHQASPPSSAVSFRASQTGRSVACSGATMPAPAPAGMC